MAELHDSFGESMEKAGYERASDSDSSFSGGGGWREDNSSDSYRSTSDRWNDHKSRYGKDKVYTDAFNERRNNSSWSGGYSAISRTIGEKYHSLANGQMSAAAPEKDQKTLTGGLFGKSYSNAPYSARQDWDNINALTPKDRIRDIAHYYAGESLSREHKGNTIGSAISSIVGSTLEPTSTAEAIASVGAQLGLTKAGTAADTLLNKEGEILGRMTPGQKAIYQTESQKVKDAFSEDMDSWGSKFKGGLATVAGVVGGALTGGAGSAPIGTAARVIADNSRYNSAMQHAADKLNSPVLNEMIIEDKAKKAQAMKDWEQMRKIAGDTEYTGQGILGTMQQRAKVKNGQYKEEENYSSIPQLVNLWNNISVI